MYILHIPELFHYNIEKMRNNENKRYMSESEENGDINM